MPSPPKTRKTSAEIFSRRVKGLMEHQDPIPSSKIGSRLNVALVNLELCSSLLTLMTEQMLQQASWASTNKIATGKLVQIADHLKCRYSNSTLARLIPNSCKFTRTILDSSQICSLLTRRCATQLGSPSLPSFLKSLKTGIKILWLACLSLGKWWEVQSTRRHHKEWISHPFWLSLLKNSSTITTLMRMACCTILAPMASVACGKTPIQLRRCRPLPALSAPSALLRASWVVGQFKTVVLRIKNTRSLAWISDWKDVWYQLITPFVIVTRPPTYSKTGTSKDQQQGKAGQSSMQESINQSHMIKTRPFHLSTTSLER